MRLHEYNNGGTDVLELAGDVDIHYAGVLRDLLRAKVRSRCPSLLLDVSRVNFINSVGIAVLLDYLRASTAFKGRFCIAGVGDDLKPIFDIIRLDRVMPVFARTADALEALANNRLPEPAEPLFKRAQGIAEGLSRGP